MLKIYFVGNEETKKEAKKEKAQSNQFTLIIDIRKVICFALFGIMTLLNVTFIRENKDLKMSNDYLESSLKSSQEKLEYLQTEVQKNKKNLEITGGVTVPKEDVQEDLPFVDSVEYQYVIPETEIRFNKPIHEINVISEEEVTNVEYHNLSWSDGNASGGSEWLDTTDKEVAYLVAEKENGYDYLQVKSGDSYTVSCLDTKDWKKVYMYFPGTFKKTAKISVYDEVGYYMHDYLNNIQPLESGSYQEVHISIFAQDSELQRQQTIICDLEET